jgi:hypothetical protein
MFKAADITNWSKLLTSNKQIKAANSRHPTQIWNFKIISTYKIGFDIGRRTHNAFVLHVQDLAVETEGRLIKEAKGLS